MHNERLTPTAAVVEAVRRMEISPAELHVIGSQMYIHFPLGQGVSKLPISKIEKSLGSAGTGRNRNTVMAEDS